MAEKTIIKCRPGMKQKIQAAFAGMEVEVDDTLDTDYIFAKRELTALEEIEAQIEEEEKQEADPKNALTFVMPLQQDDGKPDPFGTWLTVRIESNFSRVNAEAELSTVKVAYHSPGDINGIATAANVRQVLKKAGANVLSVSLADGIVFPDL